MYEIFCHPKLLQPNDEEYLWRFIKPEYVNSFLEGELYFAQLFEFDDYYESITPIYHLFYHM